MTKTLKDAEDVTPQQLRTMTPTQVDELFSAVWDVRYALVESMFTARPAVYRAVGASRTSGRGWSLPWLEAHERAEGLAGRGDAKAIRSLSVLHDYRDKVQELDQNPLKRLYAEFTRRGGWDRAFLAVTNGAGHVHSSQLCSTCHNGEQATRLHWMIEYSGKSEAEIIEAAGVRACSVCYPDAPTEDLERPTVMFSPDEIRAAQAREERARTKTVRDVEKAAKAITAADGGPLKVYTWTRKAHQKTVRGSVVDVPELEFTDTLKTLHAARGWLTDRFDVWCADSDHRDIAAVADAVAAKEGKTRDQVIDEAKVRARKRK